MKFRFLFSTLAVVILSTNAFAQEDEVHSDVEFGYDNLANPMAFEIEATGITDDGLLFFESEMVATDPFVPEDFRSNEPGFTTNSAEGLLANPSDQIWLNALDASEYSNYGVGFVNYYNPETGSLEALGRLGISDNSVSTSDLILDGEDIESGVNPQFIDSGNGAGGVHDHVIVDLLDDATAPLGAYGVLFQLQSDFAAADSTMDLSSEPFWIVFNYGLSESEFDTRALAQFGVSTVPEPGSLTLMSLGLATTLLRRRRGFEDARKSIAV